MKKTANLRSRTFLSFIIKTCFTEQKIALFQLESEEGPAEINGVIEPHNIADVPPRFELLFNEYPVPISFEEIGWC